jgi:hypothetical protein
MDLFGLGQENVNKVMNFSASIKSGKFLKQLGNRLVSHGLLSLELSRQSEIILCGL